MALSEEDKKKMLAGFTQEPKQEEEDIWTDEDLIRIANKIMERLEKNDRVRTQNKNG